MASRYFTTPIYYVNDRPHIGHLYTTVVTDVLARMARFSGEEVRFLTGTDEHGQNIEKVAKKEGIPPLAVADRNAPTFRELWKTFGISNDDFIRTTEPRHRAGVEEMIRRIAAAGDFYLASHEGWYCPPCEAFYPEKDLANGKCPVHGTVLELQKEENVFFRLSRYEKPLLDLYEEGIGGKPFVFPGTRLNEVRSFVASGLKDLSVSRTTITWGIPFPGHPGHVVYVWLDALTNYVSALGFGGTERSLFDRFWPSPTAGARAFHIVGKDILRFHAVYWPAFLMSARLPLPSQVVSHGFWLKDDRKMSKTVGNVVRPDGLVAQFGADALRWFLLSEMSFGQDASFSDEAFLTTYNADLANGLGNTLSRSVKMSRDFFDGKTPPKRTSGSTSFDWPGTTAASVARWRAAFDGYRLQEAAAEVRGLLGAIDGYVTTHEPWRARPDQSAEERAEFQCGILYDCLEALRIAACLLAPIAPGTASEVLARLGVRRSAAELTAADLAWGGLPLDAPLAVAPPLFPRADPKTFFAPQKESHVTDEKKPEGPDVNETAPVPVTEVAAAVAAASATAAARSAASPKITIDDFAKLDLRVGEVIAAEKVEKSKKLMKMTVRIGEEVRTIVGGIATAYPADRLVGKKFVFVANLAPAKLMGVESNGMILAATMPETGEPSLLMVDPAVPSGAKVK
jgi:methionyl-tRNA synthetase